MLNLAQVNIGSHYYWYAERSRFCFVDPSILFTIEYAMSLFVYSSFLVPPSGQKTQLLLVSHQTCIKKTTTVELVNRVSLYLQNAEEKRQ